MTYLHFATWNAENAFGDRQRAPHAYELVKTTDADILYLPETTVLGDHENDTFQDISRKMIEELGYTAHLLTDYYHGKRDRPNQSTMSMWSRVSSDITRHPTDNRYGLLTEVCTENGSLSVVGIHPDDNNEAIRIQTASDIVELMDGKSGVIMGDFNAMHEKDPRARLLRGLARPITRQFAKHIDIEYYPTPPARTSPLSLAVRLAEMASGDSMKIYEDAGFEDVDSGYYATIGKIPAKFKIDAILGRDVNSSNYELTKTSLSDHDLLSVDVAYIT